MQDSQYLHVITTHFVDGDERKRNEHELTGAFDASRAYSVRKRTQCRDALNYCLCDSPGGLGSVFGNVVRRFLRDHGRHLSSSGHASAAIALVDPSSNLVMVQQLPFARGKTALLDFPAEPIVMLDRVGQKVQCHLIGMASFLSGKSIQLGFKFRRHMQVHELSVG